MNEMLQELIGKRVEVWSRGTEIDEEGTLEGVDRRWLRLRNTDGQRTCFYLANVFMVRELPEEKEKKRGLFG